MDDRFYPLETDAVFEPGSVCKLSDPPGQAPRPTRHRFIDRARSALTAVIDHMTFSPLHHLLLPDPFACFTTKA